MEDAAHACSRGRDRSIFVHLIELYLITALFTGVYSGYCEILEVRILGMVLVVRGEGEYIICRNAVLLEEQYSYSLPYLSPSLTVTACGCRVARLVYTLEPT